ncbi:MAG: shikimate dehydrogenase [Stellaceae bacterium]
MSGDDRVAAVMGWPVAHSRSPLMHRYWLRHYGIAGDYVKLPVRAENLGAALRALPALGIVGANLTLPHKEAALAIVDDATHVARAIGAANTITVRPDGSLLADNSDAFGFIENLHAAALDWHPGTAPATVLGAGGAARAVVAALLDHGVPEVRLLNRNLARAEALRVALGGRMIRVLPWEKRTKALAGAGLLVNATSLGMAGASPLDLPLDRLPIDAIVDDIVYVPLETPLLAEARRRGHVAVDGLGMLLHQGRPGFALWFGTMPEVTAELRAIMEASLAP